MIRSLRVGVFAASALVLSSAVQATTFSNTWFFGDSLTDAGYFGSQFTINGAPDSGVWAQFLGKKFGVAVTPSNAGGNDYAQGGARMTGTPGFGVAAAQPLSQQLTNYLTSHPQADPNALYALWGGANDVFFQSQLVANGSATPTDAQNALIGAAQSEIGLLTQLQAAGARHLMVLNLPDIGTTPAAILEGIKAAGAAVSASSTQIANALAQATADLNGNSSTTQLAAQLQTQAIADAAAILGTSTAVVQGAVGQVQAGFSGLSTQAFNLSLSFGLHQSGLQVVGLDIQSLFAEVLADPARFGFTNVTGFACTTSSSFTCTPASVNTTQRFFFADTVHPTPQAHRLLADYAYALLEAPQLIGLLPQATLGIQDSVRQMADQGLTGPVVQSNSGLGLYAVAAAAPMSVDSNANSPGLDSTPLGVAVGLRKDISQQLRYSLQLSAFAAAPDFGSDKGGFKLRAINLGAYGRWRRGPWTLTGGLDFGTQDYSRIQRNVHLGPATDVESGSTNGYTYSFGVTGGYGFELFDWTMQPTLGLNYRKVQVSAYTETGPSASAMHFDAQQVEQIIASAGWATSRKFATSVGVLEPRLALGYHKDMRHNNRTVTGGLISMPGFTSSVYTPDDTWGTLELGLGDDLGASGRLDLTLSTLIGQASTRQTVASIAYSARF